MRTPNPRPSGATVLFWVCVGGCLRTQICPNRVLQKSPFSKRLRRAFVGPSWGAWRYFHKGLGQAGDFSDPLQTASNPDRVRGANCCWEPLLLVEWPAQAARTHNPTLIRFSSGLLSHAHLMQSCGGKQKVRKAPMRVGGEP